MSDLITLPRATVQQALEAWEYINLHGFVLADYEGPMEQAIAALKAALEQPEPTVKESLMVPQHIADHLTTTDLAWLETRRLVRVWKELGQMRWMGADEGWDKAIEAVRARLDKECQAVLEWKEKADDSGEVAKKLLHNMQGVKHD
jgi:hypothetical protein